MHGIRQFKVFWSLFLASALCTIVQSHFARRAKALVAIVHCHSEGHAAA